MDSKDNKTATVDGEGDSHLFSGWSVGDKNSLLVCVYSLCSKCNKYTLKIFSQLEMLSLAVKEDKSHQ